MSDLSYAIAAYRSNSSPDKLGEMYIRLYQTEFLIPLQENENGLGLMVMKNDSNETCLLCFSEEDELVSFFNKKVSNASVSFYQLIQILEKDEMLLGILVDPKSGNMVFEKDLLFSINETMLKNLS